MKQRKFKAWIPEQNSHFSTQVCISLIHGIGLFGVVGKGISV
jgi:hypothetical protein